MKVSILDSHATGLRTMIRANPEQFHWQQMADLRTLQMRFLNSQSPNVAAYVAGICELMGEPGIGARSRAFLRAVIVQVFRAGAEYGAPA